MPGPAPARTPAKQSRAAPADQQVYLGGLEKRLEAKQDIN